MISDGEYTVQGRTPSLVEIAKTKGVSDEQLTEEFDSLSGSIFKLRQIHIEREQAPSFFIPHKEYKNLRQDLIQKLTELRYQNSTSINSDSAIKSKEEMLNWIQTESKASPLTKPKLTLLLREEGQVHDLIDAIKAQLIRSQDIGAIILDFEFARKYEESIRLIKELGISVGLATTRILKPAEYKNLKYLANLQPDIILVRNLGALQYLMKEHSGQFELRGDFSLNVSNHLTADYLLNKGLHTVCLSYDLNQTQVSNVLRNVSAAQIEITIFQYMPSFHMEHCVFASTLSQGSSFRDCGKPCEKHQINLKDQFNNWHHIKADPECRNTMFNAKSQSASRYLGEWLNLGLGQVRYEALKERGEELIIKIAAHIEFLNNNIDSDELIKKIGAIESYGISEGQFGKSSEYQSRKKL